MAVARLCAPRSIAVLGASADDRKFGGRTLKYLLRHGFSGSLFPVNPRQEAILGVPAWRSLENIGRPIDVAVLALPTAAVEAAITDCVRAGVSVAVVITSGFAEAGDDGRQREERLMEIARPAGLRILGPNCLGVIAPASNLALTASFAMEREHLLSGSLGLVSQSGALMASLFDFATDRNAGFSICASIGNQVDLEVCDFLDYMIDDTETRVISAYVEGLVRPERFLDCARRAHEAGIPLLITKAGSSAAGAAAAQSHTARLAGSYTAFAAACRSCGATLFEDPFDMVLAGDMITRAGRICGQNVAILSGSGGGCALASDRVDRSALVPAGISSETRSVLNSWLPADRCNLPIDLGVTETGWTRDCVNAVLTGVLEDPAVSAALVVATTQPLLPETVECAIHAARRSGKPVALVFLMGNSGASARVVARTLDYPFLESLDEAMAVLEGLVRVSETLVEAPPEERVPIAPFVHRHIGRLGEHETKRLVAHAGLEVTREDLAGSASEAVEIADKLGYPVALKAASTHLIHKSDIGGIRLDLHDGASVHQAFDAIATRAQALNIPDFEGCLVQEMVPGGVELIIGCHRDTDFGAMIVIGLGGILVELVEDVQIALAPISTEQALSMLKRLRHWPILDGYRGRTPVDVESAAQAASRLSLLAVALGPRLVELDINPLLVRDIGLGAIALDGSATLGDNQ